MTVPVGLRESNERVSINETDTDGQTDRRTDSHVWYLFISSVIALDEYRRLNLAQLLSRLPLFLVFVTSIKTLNYFGRLVETTLLLICTDRH